METVDLVLVGAEGVVESGHNTQRNSELMRWGLYISSHSSPSSYLRRDRKFQLLKWTPIQKYFSPLANKLKPRLYQSWIGN